MNKRYLHLLFLAPIIIGTSCSSYNSSIKRANQQLELYNFKDAAYEFSQAWEKKEDNETARGLAYSNYKMRDFGKAAAWYSYLADKDELTAEDSYRYSESLIANSKFDESAKVLDNMILKNGEISKDEKWMMLRKSAGEAKAILNTPTKFQVKPLKSLNTSFSEFGLTIDEGVIFFSSDRISDKKAGVVMTDNLKNQRYGWTGNGFLTVYEANLNKTNDDLENIALSKVFQNENHIGPVHKSGSMMFYTVTEAGNETNKREGRRFGTTLYPEILYKEKKADGTFGEAKPLNVNSSLKYAVADPFWDESKKRLYFSSDMPGGFGGSDIYYVDYLGSDKWSSPVSLGKDINTFGNDRSPFIYDDIFYFSSEGLGGLGGLDIYKSSMVGTSFSTPENLGVPFNSNKDDFFFFKDRSRNGQVFLTSDRNGSKGLDDIYFIEELKEEFFTVTGVVKDKETGEPIENTVVTLTDTATGVNTSVVSDEKGGFAFILPLNNTYTIETITSGYFNQIKEGFSTKPNQNNKLDLNVYSEKVSFDKGIRIFDIYYDYNSADIRSDASVELRKIIEVMRDNPQFRLQMYSHTDSRGKAEYNEKLSESRGLSVVNFLSSEGIASRRVRSVGMGESKLVNDCVDVVECSEEEHQRNRRTEFVIMNLASFEKNLPYESFKFEDPDQKERIETLAVPELQAVPVNVEIVVSEEEIEVDPAIEGAYTVAPSNNYNHYIIIESWQTEYMASLRAKELSGTYKVNVIPPTDGTSNFRLSVAVYPSMEEAAKNINRFRREFNDETIWILAY
ncbi:OmpA family protein [Aquiflexum gelatinilyticum]|uniref:OmpA family protein n=1 Tax=Aquiflexum gelatinilyticum TaxID=2961943 RepID=A0A9X2P6B5_9BACT|nr:OmpA family protein [Aquiflexum gelatinilyticum]MCR9016838.1 OmpA family protein [Aquiflexum gelatinilyticum]